MSLAEKNRRNRKGESRARSLAHKYDGHKLAAGVNRTYQERTIATIVQKLGHNPVKLQPLEP